MLQRSNPVLAITRRQKRLQYWSHALVGCENSLFKERYSETLNIYCMLLSRLVKSLISNNENDRKDTELRIQDIERELDRAFESSRLCACRRK